MTETTPQSNSAPTVYEKVKEKISHLEKAVAHLFTYGHQESAKAIQEIVDEAKAHLETVKPAGDDEHKQ